MVAEHLALKDPSLFPRDLGSGAALHGRENLVLEFLDAYAFLLEEVGVVELGWLHGVQHGCKSLSRGQASVFGVARGFGSYLYLPCGARALFRGKFGILRAGPRAQTLWSRDFQGT